MKHISMNFLRNDSFLKKLSFACNEKVITFFLLLLLCVPYCSAQNITIKGKVTDSSKENENLRAIKSLATAAIQSGMATSYEAAEMLTSENLTEIKNKLKELEDRKQQLEQQAAQREQEAAMRQQELVSQMQAETNRIEEEDSIRKANTAIEIALINADSKSMQNNNAPNEYLEEAKLALTREKQSKEQSLKERQQREVERSNRVKENMKQREIEIKKKQIF